MLREGYDRYTLMTKKLREDRGRGRGRRRGVGEEKEKNKTKRRRKRGRKFRGRRGVRDGRRGLTFGGDVLPG